jgi:hypothetical protein
MLYPSLKRGFGFVTGLLFAQTIAFSQSALQPGSQSAVLTVDHQYSPPWWQTLVCLPDDPVKTLVGREGQIFGDYDYKGPRDFSFAI